MAGIITVAATRCSPKRAAVVAVFAPERRGETNEIAVSDTAVYAKSLGGASAPTKKSGGNDDAHDREDSGHRGEPGQRDRFATFGDFEVDANGLGKRSGEGGGHHRCERGKESCDGEPAESAGVARLVRCRVCDDPGVFHAVHVVAP